MKIAPIAQLDRAFDYENQKATGSNPVGCTTKTLDVLRAVEGFSAVFFYILLDFP